MIDTLQDFARQRLMWNLAKLGDQHHRLFRQMYSPNEPDKPIHEVVADLPKEKLDWAMSQVQQSVAKNGLTDVPPAGNIELPFGVVITHTGDGGTAIASNLAAALGESESPEENAYAEGVEDALECFLMALAGKDVDVSQTAFADALREAMEAIGNNMPEEG